MADSQIHSLALQDILLSMAEALNKAQNELNNMAPYDEYGRPNTIYHVPYLDFNLQVVTEFENTSSSAPVTALPIAASEPKPMGRAAGKPAPAAMAKHVYASRSPNRPTGLDKVYTGTNDSTGKYRHQKHGQNRKLYFRPVCSRGAQRRATAGIHHQPNHRTRAEQRPVQIYHQSTGKKCGQ
jgi:hypothetical protein